MSKESLAIQSSMTTRFITTSMAIGVVALILYLSSIFGPPLHAEHGRRMAAEIREENQSFCTGLGLTSGTPLFSRCEQGLERLRAKQEERTIASQAGIL